MGFKEEEMTFKDFMQNCKKMCDSYFNCEDCPMAKAKYDNKCVSCSKFMMNCASVAVEILKSWMKENEIKVGDIVRHMFTNEFTIVTAVNNKENIVGLLYKDGSFHWLPQQQVEKTKFKSDYLSKVFEELDYVKHKENPF